MAELADAQDLGSCGAIRVGSTPTGGIFKQECEVSAKLNLTPVILVYQGLQVFLILNNFTFDSICASFVHHCQNLGHQAGLQHDSPT